MAANPEPPDAQEAPKSPYRRPAADVVAELGGDARRGLRAEEIEGRLRRHGRNELPSEPPIPAWRRFLGQFRDALTLLLIVATVVSFAAWWIEREAPLPYEALTILAIVLLNGVLGFAQESRADPSSLRGIPGMDGFPLQEELRSRRPSGGGEPLLAGDEGDGEREDRALHDPRRDRSAARAAAPPRTRTSRPGAAALPAGTRAAPSRRRRRAPPRTSRGRGALPPSRTARRTDHE
jgi:Ca2+-transporting ATPase